MGEDFRTNSAESTAGKTGLLSDETRNKLALFCLTDSLAPSGKSSAEKQPASESSQGKDVSRDIGEKGSQKSLDSRSVRDPIAEAIAQYFTRQTSKQDKSSGDSAAASTAYVLRPGTLPNVDFVPAGPPLPGTDKTQASQAKVAPRTDGSGAESSLSQDGKKRQAEEAGNSQKSGSKPQGDAVQPDKQQASDAQNKAGQDTRLPGKDKAARPADKLELHYTTADAAKAAELARSNNLPLVVHVGATWCPPCRGLEANVWPKVEPALNGKAVFLHIDVDQAENMPGRAGEIARHLMEGGGTSIPKIFMATATAAADGQVTADVALRYNGNRSIRDLTDFITRFRK